VTDLVGLDIALRWLHVGRRRLLDDRIAVPPLVCAGAEALPFPDGRFDLVVCVATLEFTRDPGQALAESARVLRPGGILFVNTVNRFSLATEPHVGLWGVGFLPRAWQAPYVRLRGRGAFGNVHLLSHRDLHRLARRHFRRRRVEPADLPPEVASGLSAPQRLGVRAYRRLRTMPPARALLRRLGPEWDAVLTRD
jgi:SAM-dependent methyltransferase